MTNSQEILDRVTRTLDNYKREIDRDDQLRQVRIVVRRTASGKWITQFERSSDEEA